MLTIILGVPNIAAMAITLNRHLTHTDLATAQMLSAGMTRKHMARQARISVNSVKSRVDTLLFKTRSNNAVEAVHKITKAGFLCALVLLAPDDFAFRKPRNQRFRIQHVREVRV